jgi:hypothetical protein
MDDNNAIKYLAWFAVIGSGITLLGVGCTWGYQCWRDRQARQTLAHYNALAHV